MYILLYSALLYINCLMRPSFYAISLISLFVFPKCRRVLSLTQLIPFDQPTSLRLLRPSPDHRQIRRAVSHHLRRLLDWEPARGRPRLCSGGLGPHSIYGVQLRRPAWRPDQDPPDHRRFRRRRGHRHRPRRRRGGRRLCWRSEVTQNNSFEQDIYFSTNRFSTKPWLQFCNSKN